MECFFNIYGIPVRLESLNQKVISEMAEELSCYRVDVFDNSLPKIHITFHDPAQEPQPKTLPAQDIREMQVEGCTVTMPITMEIVGSIDLKNFTVDVFAKQGWNQDDAILVMTTHIGYLVRIILSRRGPFAALHGAALTLDGKGIILAGHSSAGKTSLSYLLANNGWEYLTDEHSFVVDEKRGGFKLKGFSRRLRIDQRMADTFPEIFKRSGKGRPFESFWQKGTLYNCAPVLDMRHSDTNPLKLVVFLHNDPDRHDPPRITALSRSNTLFHLLGNIDSVALGEGSPEIMAMIQAYNRNAFSIINRLIDEVSALRVDYNIHRDFLLMPNLVQEAVTVI
jgi:hypothetical protein